MIDIENDGVPGPRVKIPYWCMLEIAVSKLQSGGVLALLSTNPVYDSPGSTKKAQLFADVWK